MKRVFQILITIWILSLIFSFLNDDEQETTKKEVVKKEVVKKEVIKKIKKSKTEYDLLKEKSILLGKWNMEFTNKGLENNSVIIEIYKNGETYIEVWKENKISIKNLIKDGNKYLTEQKGEYYIITESGDLKSYDEEGYIGEENGFKYVKL